MNTPHTRDSLLDAAERLFAIHGVDGASVRDITAEAGANLASVNYHFGGKDVLLREVLLRRVRRLIDERNRLLLVAVEAAGKKPPTVRSVMNAFIFPTVHMAAEYPHFAKLLARVQFEGMFQVVGEMVERTFHNSLQSFVEQLKRALPKLTPEEIRLRLVFSVGSFAFVVMNTKTICAAVKITPVSEDPAGLADRLVDFCTAGMEAAPGRANRKGAKR